MSMGPSLFQNVLSAQPPRLSLGDGPFVARTYAKKVEIGPDGVPRVVEAKETQRADGQGFQEARYEARSPEEQRVGILRGAGDQVFAAEKRRGPDLPPVSSTQFVGLNAQQLPQFDATWASHTTQNPFWSPYAIPANASVPFVPSPHLYSPVFGQLLSPAGAPPLPSAAPAPVPLPPAQDTAAPAQETADTAPPEEMDV
jgi:hypothetical protein